MKITLKPYIHNCDKHFKVSRWYEDINVVEELKQCEICNKIKEHWAYGSVLIEDWTDVQYGQWSK